MDLMEQRKTIAAQLDGHAEAWRTVNDQPEVKAAREAIRAAMRAAEEAHERFSAIFNMYAPSDDRMAERLQLQYPGLVLLGDEYPHVCRCAVSGLPIFVGDKVFKVGERDEDTYILAEVIQLTPAFAHLEPTVITAEVLNTGLDEEEEDEAA